MVPFLLAAVASDGSVTFDSNAPASTDFWIGPQRYGAAKVFGTEDAVAGTDTRANGLRYTSEGVIRVYDATSAVPAGATTLGGFAVTSDGQLCVSTDAVASATFVGGIAVRSDGAVFATGLSTPRSIADAIITALSPAAWYRNATDVVSSGGFASIWADYASTAQGLVLPGVVSNSASIPDAAYWPTVNIDARIRLQMSDWTPAGNVTFFAKNGGAGQTSFRLNLNTTGVLAFISSTDGTTVNVSTTSTASLTVSDGDALWVRVTRNSATGDVIFYQAADSSTMPASWTQVGTTVVSGTGGMFDSTADVVVGHGTGALNATVYRFVMYSDLTETTKVLDADFSAQAIGTASFTESSSNAATVTINTSGASPAHIGKARDLLQGTGTNQPAYAAGIFTFDGADNFLIVAFAQAQPLSVVFVGSQVSWTANDTLIDGSTGNTMRVYQKTATPNISMYAGSDGPQGTNLVVGNRSICAFVFNNASSSFRVNNNAKSTGTTGSSASAGVTLGAFGTGAAFANMTAEEFILFPTALSDTEQDSVITALNNALTVF